MDKKKKFEEKIEELEIIINKLENGEQDLDESIDEYTKAMKLVKECDKEIKDYEEHINKIVMENGEQQDFKIEEEKEN